MNWFSTPKRVEIGDVILNVVITLVILLFAPDRVFENANVNWLFGLIVVLPVSFFAGLLSYWLYYLKHDANSIDPFYIRACWGAIAGAVAWPVCLLFRPSVADFAFILLTFGAGSVLAFHVCRRKR